jgi:hypothetical protein
MQMDARSGLTGPTARKSFGSPWAPRQRQRRCRLLRGKATITGQYDPPDLPHSILHFRLLMADDRRRPIGYSID